MRKRLLLSTLCFAAIAGANAQAGPAEATQQLIESLGLRESKTPSSQHPRWRNNPRIVVLIPGRFSALAPNLEPRLRAVARDADIQFFRPTGGLEPSADVVRDADVYLGSCFPSILKNADDLVWLQTYSVGVERCTSSAAVADTDVVLTNAQRLSAPTIAEHTIAMLLMLNRNLPAYYQAQRDNRWAPDVSTQRVLTDLSGKTMLVVGLGGIGTEIARRAHGLGMRVIATRNSRREGPEFVDYVGLSDELLELAAGADVVANATPLTPSTRNLFDSEFFSKVKQGSVFLTVGRGQSTDTAALVAALKSGHVAAAGLDVTDPEPLPSDHELWQMSNVIITPHVSASSANTVQRIVAILEENLRRYIAGEPLLNVVNWERGY